MRERALSGDLSGDGPMGVLLERPELVAELQVYHAACAGGHDRLAVRVGTALAGALGMMFDGIPPRRPAASLRRSGNGRRGRGRGVAR